MSLEYDADDVDSNAALSYRFWQWLSRLCGSGNTSPESVYDAQTNRRRPKRKAVTFALDWDDQYEAALCSRCRLARGDPGINRLDRIAKAHDIDYDKAKTLKDKWAADRKMIAKIDQLPGSKNLTERIVRRIMKAKLRLGM